MMTDERIVLRSIFNSEVENLKGVFEDALTKFYKEYDGRIDLRREKVVKYLCIVNDLIVDAKVKVQEVIDE